MHPAERRRRISGSGDGRGAVPVARRASATGAVPATSLARHGAVRTKSQVINGLGALRVSAPQDVAVS